MKPILIAMAAGLILATPLTAEVDVTLLSIQEQRSKTIEKAPGERSFANAQEGNLTIQLMLGGPEAKAATHIGPAVFTEAKDDTGKSLARDQRGGWGDRFNEINREHMWFMSDDPPDDKIKVDLNLQPTSRGAKMLALVQGTLTLRTTATQEVLVAPEAGLEVKDPLLDASGVKVTLKEVDAEQGSLQLVVVDPDDKVGEIECVNSEGEDITMGTSSFGFNKSKQMSLDTGEPLPEGAKLRIAIKTEVTDLEVPFKLENVELP